MLRSRPSVVQGPPRAAGAAPRGAPGRAHPSLCLGERGERAFSIPVALSRLVERALPSRGPLLVVARIRALLVVQAGRGPGPVVSARGLLVGEVWLALLDEGGHALLLVLGGEERPEGLHLRRV